MRDGVSLRIVAHQRAARAAPCRRRLSTDRNRIWSIACGRAAIRCSCRHSNLVRRRADRELDRRLVHHAVVDALEPVVEEAHLIRPALLGVERMHVGAGLDAQLLVLGGGAHEGLGVAAQMQADAGPVADREHRHGDLVPLRLRAVEGAAVEIVAQPEVQRVDLPRHRALLRGAAERVVHQMRGEPVGHEHARGCRRGSSASR